MTRLRAFLYRIRGLFLKNKLEREFDAEIQSHIEMQIDENKRSGMSDDEARYAALRMFGGVEQVKENHRDKRTFQFTESIIQDIKYAVRMLIKTPVFTLVTIVTLGIGIGANTAVFSVINAMMLKNLPVKSPNELLLFRHRGSQSRGVNFSYPQYERFRNQNHSFSEMAALGSAGRMRMGIVDNADARSTEQVVSSNKVSGNYFSVLGVNAVIGRTLTEADDKKGNPQATAVISHEFWERKFHRDPAIIGKKITLDNIPFTIVGVIQSNFSGLEIDQKMDIWWPLNLHSIVEKNDTLLSNPFAHWLMIVGRKLPDIKTKQANSDIDLLFQPILREGEKIATSQGIDWSPTERADFLNRKIELVSGNAGWTDLRDSYIQPLIILIIVTILVLLIACLNIASLLTARATSRKHEIALRLSIGANRLRLVRQFFTESVMMAIIGGILGLIIAQMGVRVLLTYLPKHSAQLLDVTPDIRILLFTLIAAISTSLIFGLLPALQATKSNNINLNTILNANADGRNIRSSHSSLRKILMVVQISLSLLLLVGASLLDRSLYNFKSMDTGFAKEKLILFEIIMGKEYTPNKQIQFYEKLKERIGSIPGTQSSSISSTGILSGQIWTNNIAAEGNTAHRNNYIECYLQPISFKFFATMEIPIKAGRDFGIQDKPSIQPEEPINPRVAILAETLAKQLFPNGNPIGKHIYRQHTDPKIANQPIEVVGIAGDLHYLNLREEMPRTIYFPYQQTPNELGDITVEVRTAIDTNNTATSLQKIVNELDPGLQISNLRTIDDVINSSLSQERFVAQIGSFFSILALLISCIGLYGVVAYTVKQRTREIGIRIALGAQHRDVVLSILRETLTIVGMGVFIGLIASLWSMHFIEHLLFNVSHNDPVTISIAVISLIITTVLASWIPARKAATVDPMIALRCE